VINQPITFYGANFDVGAATVRFGQIPAKIVGTPSATQLVARVPGGLTPAGAAQSVKVTITNAGGSVTSDDIFTVKPAPAFADPGGKFSPAKGTQGTLVTLNGFNFNVSPLLVQFGSITVEVVEPPPSATQAKVKVPAGLVPSGSTTADVKITVTTGM